MREEEGGCGVEGVIGRVLHQEEALLPRRAMVYPLLFLSPRRLLIAGGALLLCVTALWEAGALGALLDVQRHPVPKRIVSLNLCADQLLLALADRDDIAGLTRYAGDPLMSAAAKQAQGMPILDSSAESVIAAQPDLLVGMPARRSAVVAALARHDYPTLDVRKATSFADVKDEIRLVADRLGKEARGAELIRSMGSSLAALPRPGRGRVAAYYQRRGYLTGSGTLIDDLMHRAGLVNLSARLGKPALARVSVEEIVAARPDFLIVDDAAARITDQGKEMLNHPALRSIPRLHLPQAWTVCGGPAYVLAARSLIAQVAEHDAAGRMSR